MYPSSCLVADVIDSTSFHTLSDQVINSDLFMGLVIWYLCGLFKNVSIERMISFTFSAQKNWINKRSQYFLTLRGLSRNDVTRPDHAGVIIDLRGLTR